MPVANRTNWTLRRLATELEQREGVHISKSRLSVCCGKKGVPFPQDVTHAKGRQDADAVDYGGLRLKLRKAQAEAGDVVLLFADESEALTHLYFARAWSNAASICAFPRPVKPQRWP